MRTKPMKHQKLGLKRLAAAPEFFALGAEQGTGKTWMLLADAEAQYAQGRINALMIIAPKSVYTNWIRREIPRHVSVPVRCGFWVAGASKKHMRSVDRLLRTETDDEMLVFAVNVDAVNTKQGHEAAVAFLKRYKCMLAIDESQRIKNPNAARTKRVVEELGPLAVSRRIMSGTLVADNPLDLYMQYHFLKPGLLGTTSYRAFVAEYAHLLPASHPMLARVRGNPQVVKKDSEGRPMYRNLDKLRRLLMPHTFRVLKKDCLDLPEKIYQTRYFELSAKQRALYNSVKTDLFLIHDDGEMDLFTALTVLGKLRQITSGFVLVNGEPSRLGCTARLDALKDTLEDLNGQVIIWAHYKEEIRMIKGMLGDEAVELHGDVKRKDRDEAVDRFQRGEARYFVSNPDTGGTGLTLTAANAAIYYSNDFSLEKRLQSEDRCHRIGTKGDVVYIDLIATDTIDERIVNALQAKQEIAACILDDI